MIEETQEQATQTENKLYERLVDQTTETVITAE